MTDENLSIIEFHGTKLIVANGNTPAETLVAMKPVVEGMGLQWAAQFVKIKHNPVLSKGVSEIEIPSGGGLQSMTALPLSRLSFWLATIQPNKIPNQSIRAKVIEYQTECADVLFEHFFGKVRVANDVRYAANDDVLSPDEADRLARQRLASQTMSIPEKRRSVSLARAMYGRHAASIVADKIGLWHDMGVEDVVADRPAMVQLNLTLSH